MSYLFLSCTEKFSIIQFYTNRAVRIIPALAILCIFLLILGWFQLIPTDFKALSKHIIASLFFISNIIYWRESGYFDADAHEKILLHTWSLSVEWQFYLFLPIYLIIAYKLFKNKTSYSLVFLFVISLIFAHFLSTYRPSASFFLLPTRAWEMVLGGFLYFIPKPNINKITKNLLEIIGFLAILVSLFLFTSSTPWSSLYTLLPTLGTALILYVQNQESIFTNNKIAQFLGTSSYSIYLWHWPIVFWMFHKDQQENFTFIFVGILLSIILGYFSAKYIEKGVGNTLKKYSLIKLNLIIAGSCVAIAAISAAIFVMQGADLKYRNAANTPQALLVEKYLNEHKNIGEAYMLQCDVYSNLKNSKNALDPSCLSPTKNTKSLFLWGDSHSQALSLGLRTAFPNYSFNQIGSSGCKASLVEPISMTGELKQACSISNNLALEKIKEIKPTVVVIAQQNEHDKSDWKSIINKLNDFGVEKIIIVGAVPQWHPSLPKIMIKNTNFSSKKTHINDSGLDLKIIEDDIKAEKTIESLKIKNAQYISLINQMCNIENEKYFCETKISNDLLQVDYGHLSKAGSIYIVDRYIKSHI